MKTSPHSPLPNTQPFDVVRAVEIKSAPKNQRWLVESLWAHEAVGFIGGTPKSLKSWIGLDLAVSVATHTPCLGRFPVHQPGPALIYLAEDRLEVVRERLNSLVVSRGILLATLNVLVITTPAIRLDLPDHLHRLKATIATHSPRLLLLDPFVRLHRADENSAQDVAAILASLRELQRIFHLAIVVVHHTRKNSSARQMGQALRGSGDLHAWSDSAIYLSHEKQGLKLSIEQRAAPAPDPSFVRLDDNPPHPVITTPEKNASPSLHDRLLDTLQRSPEPLTRTALRQRLAVQNQRLGKALRHLEALGRINKTSKGWSA